MKNISIKRRVRGYAMPHNHWRHIYMAQPRPGYPSKTDGKTGLEAAERPTAALGELQEFLASNGRVLNGL